MRKTNFRASDKDQNENICEGQGSTKVCIGFHQAQLKSYSQWFFGKENIVEDALSWDDDRTEDKLTSILYCFAPHQMPNLFRTIPLPNKIVLWLISLLLKLPVKEQYREAHTRTKLGRGKGGTNIVNHWTHRCLPQQLFA